MRRGFGLRRTKHNELKDSVGEVEESEAGGFKEAGVWREKQWGNSRK